MNKDLESKYKAWDSWQHLDSLHMYEFGYPILLQTAPTPILNMQL